MVIRQSSLFGDLPDSEPPARPDKAAEAARSKVRRREQTETTLPPLPPPGAASPEENKPAEPKSRGRPKSSRGRKPKTLAAKKPPAPDLYAILGAAPADTPEMLRKKYLAKVKEFPPESHPEMFQQVRAAYETLRDPEQRRRYDETLRHGESADELVKKACALPRGARGKKQAQILFEKALQIDPAHREARFCLAKLMLEQSDLAGFEEQFAALRALAPETEWPDIWAVKIELLVGNYCFAQAGEELDRLKTAFPRAVIKHWPLFSAVYDMLDRTPGLAQELADMLRARPEPDPEDIGFYLTWVYVADDEDDEKEYDRAVAATRKYIKSLRGQEQRARVAEVLAAEAERYRDDLGLGRAIAGLALLADPVNPALKAEVERLDALAGILRELNQASQDHKIFPPLLCQALHWFIEDFNFSEEDIPDELSDILEEAEEFTGMEEFQRPEMFAAGYAYLKRRYPLLYRRYQARWEALIKEKTAGMSREDRRSWRY